MSRSYLYLALAASTLLAGCQSGTSETDPDTSESAIYGGRPAAMDYPVVLKGYLTNDRYPYSDFRGEWTSPFSEKTYWLSAVRPGVLIADDLVFWLYMDMPFVRKTLPTPIVDEATFELVQQERLDPAEGTHPLARLSFTFGIEDQQCYPFLGNTDSCWPRPNKKIYFERQTRTDVMQFEGGPVPGAQPALIGDTPPVAGERCKVAGYSAAGFPLKRTELDIVIQTSPDADGIGTLEPTPTESGRLGTGDPIFCGGELKGFIHDYIRYSGIDKAELNRRVLDMGHAPLP